MGEHSHNRLTWKGRPFWRMGSEPGYSRPVEVPGNVSTERVDGVTVVVLNGEHDLSTAQSVRGALAGARDEGTVVIDLGPATFVDSSILGVILDARRQASETRSGFAVVLDGDGHDPVRRVLEITGLLEELPVHDSREEAIGFAATAPGPP